LIAQPSEESCELSTGQLKHELTNVLIMPLVLNIRMSLLPPLRSLEPGFSLDGKAAGWPFDCSWCCSCFVL